MSRHFEVVAISSPGKYLVETGEKEHVRTIALKLKRTVAPINDLLAVFKLYLILRKEKPLIVHTHTPKAGMVGMLASWLAGVPIRLHTVAGLPLMETKGIKKAILLCVEGLTYWCAMRVYPNSLNLRKYILEKNLCEADKVKVIAKGSSNGIDLEYYDNTDDVISSAVRWKRRLAVTNEFVFLFIGRLVKDKGLTELVDAFRELRKEYANIRLLLVGVFEEDRDPLDPATLEQIRTGERITIVDWQDDIRPLLALSHVLVYPSYREGFPNVPLQAGAMSLPCIVSDINGCNEIIEHGKNGLIVPPKDRSRLQDSMRKLLEDTELYNHMRAMARPHIMQNFDQKLVWASLLDEYMSLTHSYDIQNVHQEVAGSAV